MQTATSPQLLRMKALLNFHLVKFIVVGTWCRYCAIWFLPALCSCSGSCIAMETPLSYSIIKIIECNVILLQGSTVLFGNLLLRTQHIFKFVYKKIKYNKKNKSKGGKREKIYLYSHTNIGLLHI